MPSRPTKYAHITPNLPKMSDVDSSRRDVLETVKTEILTPPRSVVIGCRSLRFSLLKEADTLVASLLKELKLATEGERHASTFAAVYADIRSIMDTFAAWTSSAQLLLEAYEELMVEQMEEEGVASLRLESGASISTYAEPHASVVDKEAFRQWCVANGYEQQLQMLWMAMNKITKERLLEGDAPPAGVDVFAKTMVRLNKS